MQKTFKNTNFPAQIMVGAGGKLQMMDGSSLEKYLLSRPVGQKENNPVYVVGEQAFQELLRDAMAWREHQRQQELKNMIADEKFALAS